MNSLGISAKRVDEVMEDRKVRWLNLNLLPPQPSGKSGAMKLREKSKQTLLINIFAGCNHGCGSSQNFNASASSSS